MYDHGAYWRKKQGKTYELAGGKTCEIEPTQPQYTLTEAQWEYRDKLFFRFKGLVYRISHKLNEVKDIKELVGVEELVLMGDYLLLEQLTKYVSERKPEIAITSTIIWTRVDGDLKDWLRRETKSGITGVDHRRFWRILNNDFDPRRLKDFDDIAFVTQYIDSLDRAIGEGDGGEPLTYHDVVAKESLTPEEQLIVIESKDKNAEKFKAFVDSLNVVERKVLQRHILQHKPWSTRKLGKKLDLSNKTISNIAARVRKKAEEHWMHG